LHLIFAFRFPDNDTEVIAALGTGSGEVYSHSFTLALPSRSFNSAPGSLYAISPFFSARGPEECDCYDIVICGTKSAHDRKIAALVGEKRIDYRLVRVFGGVTIRVSS
jgi:hypothetical protein